MKLERVQIAILLLFVVSMMLDAMVWFFHIGFVMDVLGVPALISFAVFPEMMMGVIIMVDDWFYGSLKTVVFGASFPILLAGEFWVQIMLWKMVL